jgi:DNA-binding NtrC family response regulator
MSNLLIIESDADLQSRIINFFTGNGYSVDGASSFNEAVEFLESSIYDVVCADCGLSDGDVVEVLHRALLGSDVTMVIVSFDVETVEDVVSAIQQGAFDSIRKPYKLVELYLKVDKAVRIRRLEYEAQHLRGERNLIYKTDDFIANSPRIQSVLDKAWRIARSNSSVMLLGESGTGKELLAGAVHYSSHRAKEAFVRVNCAALPDELLESELFGHERGAFTGADRQRIGRFEQADCGSIFLDEIGDMSQKTQAKVLRVLQEKEFERLGSSKTIQVDVRVISATNKDLEKEIEEKRFREDLYYRLNVIKLHLPPLRERQEDILPLVHHFLRKYAGDLKKQEFSISPQATEMLMSYDWPGNIRQLQNAVERAVLLADGDMIRPGDFGIEGFRSAQVRIEDIVNIPPDGIHLGDVEKALILQALERTDYVQKDAAVLLGVSRRVLNYKIKNHGITHTKWKTNR